MMFNPNLAWKKLVGNRRLLQLNNLQNFANGGNGLDYKAGLAVRDIGADGSSISRHFIQRGNRFGLRDYRSSVGNGETIHDRIGKYQIGSLFGRKTGHRLVSKDNGERLVQQIVMNRQGDVTQVKTLAHLNPNTRNLEARGIFRTGRSLQALPIINENNTFKLDGATLADVSRRPTWESVNVGMRVNHPAPTSPAQPVNVQQEE